MSYFIETYLPFTKDELPARKIYTISGKDYGIYIDYNSVGDFYTVEISDTDGNILLTNKLTSLSVINDAIIAGLDITQQLAPVCYEIPNSSDPITSDTFDKFKIFLMGIE